MIRKNVFLVLMLFSINSFGQSIRDLNYGFSIGFGYSTERLASIYGLIRLPFDSDSKFLIGFDYSSNFAETGIGRDYSLTLSKYNYPNEIYSIATHKIDALSLIGGTMLTKNIGILGKIGGGDSGVFYNAFDNSYILSNTGYYFIMETLPNEFIYGISGVIIFRPLSILFGWDNFSGISVGMGISL